MNGSSRVNNRKGTHRVFEVSPVVTEIKNNSGVRVPVTNHVLSLNQLLTTYVLGGPDVTPILDCHLTSIPHLT